MTKETVVMSKATTVEGLRPTLSEKAAQAKADAHWKSDMSPKPASTQNPTPSGDEVMGCSIAGYRSTTPLAGLMMAL